MACNAIFNEVSEVRRFLCLHLGHDDVLVVLSNVAPTRRTKTSRESVADDLPQLPILVHDSGEFAGDISEAVGAPLRIKAAALTVENARFECFAVCSGRM